MFSVRLFRASFKVCISIFSRALFNSSILFNKSSGIICLISSDSSLNFSNKSDEKSSCFSACSVTESIDLDISSRFFNLVFTSSSLLFMDCFCSQLNSDDFTISSSSFSQSSFNSFISSSSFFISSMKLLSDISVLAYKSAKEGTRAMIFLDIVFLGPDTLSLSVNSK